MEQDIYRKSRFFYILEAAFEYFIAILVGGAYIAKVTQELGLSDIRLILNRVDKRRLKKGSSWTVDGSMDELGLRLFGIVREDRAVADAFSAGVPLLAVKSKAGPDIAVIAGRLCGKRVSNESFYGYF